MPSPNLLKIFISYSHQDCKYLERLLVHLVTLERDGLIDIWSDTKIVPGSNWREEISQAIDPAKVAVLLVSADFLASQFIAENELPPLLAAAKTKGTVILPIILSPCSFASSTLSQFQAVNSPSYPLSRMSRHQKEEQWAKVAEIIRETVTAQQSPQTTAPAVSQVKEEPYSDILRKEPLSAKKPSRDTTARPMSLPHFEDRVLYHLVSLTGPNPLPLGAGVSEADLAVRLADELGIPPDFPFDPQFHTSDERGVVLAAVTTLEQEGLLDAIKVFGPWTIRPTLAGRRAVEQWEEQWKKSQDKKGLPITASPDFKILTSPTFQTNSPNWIDVNAAEQRIDIKNIGKENAYDIYAVLYGCETYIVPQTMPQRRMDGNDGYHWREFLGCPIEPGNVVTLPLLLRRDKLNGEQEIGGYKLYAPQEPGMYDMMYNTDLPFHSARLTLTYRDRFGNKYAQTFDYDHNRKSWIYLSHPTAIAQDFLDIL
jgi:TIR domain